MMQRTMASKEDLKSLATKAELEEIRAEMATKEDLKRLATKAEMEAGFFAVNRRIDLLREDVSDIPTMREELHGFRKRLERVEHKVGLAR